MEIYRSDTFDAWMRGLRDRVARARVEVRIRRLSIGIEGHHRVLRRGVRELKIDHGPGYRVYYALRGDDIVLLLCGGDKSTQQADIIAAIRITADWEHPT